MSIDHKQYDRQIRLWGLAAQQRMSEAKVLVFGIRGITSEICKNLVLAGIGHLTIIDDTILSFEDLGCQFFANEDDVGKRGRAESCVTNLRALNPLGNVVVGNGSAASLTEDILKAFDVVCVTSISLSEQLRINAICRQHRIRFFSTSCHGLYASLFLDLNTHDYTVEIKKKADDFSLKDFKTGRYLSKDDAMGFSETKEALCKLNKLEPSVFDDDLIHLIGAQMEVEISPVCSIVGGMAADQVIKSVTGKEKPLKNLFIFDGRDGMGAVYSVE